MKERSIRKYGKSPKEVSFFERSITGHPGAHKYILDTYIRISIKMRPDKYTYQI